MSNLKNQTNEATNKDEYDGDEFFPQDVGDFGDELGYIQETLEYMDELPDREHIEKRTYDLFHISELGSVSMSLPDPPEWELQKNDRQAKGKYTSLDKVIISYIDEPNEKNFTKMWNSMWKVLLSRALKIVGEITMAEEVVIDTLNNIREKYHTFKRDKATPITWAFCICTYNGLRRKKAAKKHAERFEKKDIGDFYVSGLKQGAVSDIFIDAPKFDNYVMTSEGLELCGRDEIVQMVRDVSIMEISNLKDKRVMDCLLAQTEDCLSMKQIATKFGLTESTVKNVLHKGKRDLRRIIKKNHPKLYELYEELK